MYRVMLASHCNAATIVTVTPTFVDVAAVGLLPCWNAGAIVFWAGVVNPAFAGRRWWSVLWAASANSSVLPSSPSLSPSIVVCSARGCIDGDSLLLLPSSGCTPVPVNHHRHCRHDRGWCRRAVDEGVMFLMHGKPPFLHRSVIAGFAGCMQRGFTRGYIRTTFNDDNTTTITTTTTTTTTATTVTATTVTTDHDDNYNDDEPRQPKQQPRRRRRRESADSDSERQRNATAGDYDSADTTQTASRGHFIRVGVVASLV
ncbi:hypothetical protein EDB83DRAFT_2317714 [Lactarius deliciosus]|nr:hypothetical protein EDB83DRAFT_2317714 [Lactarius deliciosus]